MAHNSPEMSDIIFSETWINTMNHQRGSQVSLTIIIFL